MSKGIFQRVDWMAISQLSVVLLSALTTFLSARVLGNNAWGAITFLATINSITTLTSLVGVPTFIARSISRKSAGLEIEALRLISFVFGSAFGALVGILASHTQIMRESEVSTVYIVCFTTSMVLFFVLVENSFAVLQGKKRLIPLAIFRISMVAVPGFLVLLSSAWLNSLQSALFAMQAGTLIVVIGAIWFERLDSGSKFLSRLSGRGWLSTFIHQGWTGLKSLRSSMTSYLATLLILIAYRIDLVVASNVFKAETIALVGLSLLVVETTWFASNARSIATFADNSSKSFEQARPVLIQTLRFSLKWAVIMAIVLLPCVFMFSEYSFRDQFSGMFELVFYLLPGIFVFIPVKIFMSFELARGRLGLIATLCLMVIFLKILLLLSVRELETMSFVVANNVAYLLAALILIAVVKRRKDSC